MNNLEFEINNASVDMVELGWQEVIITKDGKDYTIEFETEETSESKGFSSVTFANERSAKNAEEIGFEITEDFCNDLFLQWVTYSNKHFRG